MQHIARVGAFVALMAVAGVTGGAAGGLQGDRYYAVSWANGRMFEINATTLAGTQVAAFGDSTQSANAMTEDGLGRLLVVSAKNGRADQIVTFDPATNEYLPGRVQTTLNFISGMALSPQGELLVINNTGVHSVDRSTGAATLVAPTPGPTQGLGYGPDGALYATGNNGFQPFLSRYTPGSGWATVGNPAPGTSFFVLQTLFTGPGQTLMAARLASGGNTLYHLDHHTGQILGQQVMNLTGVSIDVRGMEFVPSPGGVGVMLGGALFATRRRRAACAR
ncbi:MAG TPA: hypothetical protein VD997_13470 [Phycisphaerales bacterium]|nr:hypothetical protein [Phycisphaerales bacterium]